MEFLRIRVMNRLNLIEAVQACVKTVAAQYKLPGKEIQRLNIAVEEAMVNVINYGLAQEGQEYFEVAVQVNEAEFAVVICDKGVPGDFLLDNYDDKLGVRIMQHVLDKLMIKNLGSGGREQHLIKYLSVAPAFEKRVQEEHAELPTDVVFDIHPLRADEAIEVARCIYDEFGFSYVSERVYYPEQFFDACRAGSVYSLVATAPNGEIAGHLAVSMLDDFPGLAEMGIGVVKKKYRNYSVMKYLMEQILEYSEKSPAIKALIGEPVTYHPITQKMCERYGLVPCGINLQYIFSDLSNSFSDSNQTRGSVGVAIKVYGQGEKHQIYVPDEVKDIIESVYGLMGVSAEFAETSRTPGSAKSRLTAKSDQRLKLGKIFVYETGEDIDQQIKLAILTLKREKCQTVIMYLNMFDPAITSCYQTAVANGFFCTGCLPMAENGDYLCMELLLDSPMDYSTLVTTPGFSALLEKIKKLDPNNVTS